MRILLTIYFLLNFGVCTSQSFIDRIIRCSHNSADLDLRLLFGKQIFDNNFKFEESKTEIVAYDKKKDRLAHLTLDEFRRSDYPAIEFYLNYTILDENQVLTELSIPFNLNCMTPWEAKDYEEILDPYLKVLQNKTKIGLKKAQEIGRKNGLDEIYDWDIDHEENKLVWTLKSRYYNDGKPMGRNVIKINSKNGKVLSKFIEIPID